MSLKEKSAVWWIIAINLLVYILFIFYPSAVNYFAITANSILNGQYIWTLLTHMFSHALFFHLFVNMFSLWFVGRFVERIIGRRRFWIFYLAAGLFAGAVSVLGAGYFGYGIGERIFGSPSIPMLGASGAIFGLVGVLAVLVPYSRVYLIAGPLIAILAGAVVSSFVSSEAVMSFVYILINIYVLVSIFLMFSFNPSKRKIILPIEMPFWLLPIVAIVPLMIIGLFVFLPIGNIAHLAGLIAGLVYGFYLRTKYKRKVMLLQRHFR